MIVAFPRNSYNLAAERGNSDFDLRHRLSINYSWELPFGKGRTYLGEGVLGRIREGFQLSGITSFQTGHPYDIWGTRDSQHTGLSDRAELIGNTRDFSGCSVGGSSLYAGLPSQTLTGVSYCAFANPDYNTASNLGRISSTARAIRISIWRSLRGPASRNESNWRLASSCLTSSITRSSTNPAMVEGRQVRSVFRLRR